MKIFFFIMSVKYTVKGKENMSNSIIYIYIYKGITKRKKERERNKNIKTNT